MEKTSKRKFHGSFKVVAIIVSIIFGIYALTMVYPVFWAFLMSFKSSKEYRFNAYGMPEQWRFDNYIKAFSELVVDGNNYWDMTWNSIWYTFGTATLGISALTIGAYFCAKYKTWAGDYLYWCSLLSMVIPIGASLGSQLVMTRQLNIYDSPLNMINATGAVGMEMLIMRATFKGIDNTYTEAAYLDGASHWQIFVKINLPMAMPVCLAYFMQHAMTLWNDAIGVFLFYPSYPTLNSGLYIYQQNAERVLAFPILYAGLLMSAIPSIILFLALRNNMFNIKITGALKQ